MDGRCVLRCPARAIVVLDVFRAAGSPSRRSTNVRWVAGHSGTRARQRQPALRHPPVLQRGAEHCLL